MKELNKKLESEKGREIIHDISVDIQEFLYLHNKPPSKSFFEQRLERRKSMIVDDDDLHDDSLIVKSRDQHKKSSEDSWLVRIQYIYNILILK